MRKIQLVSLLAVTCLLLISLAYQAQGTSPGPTAKRQEAGLLDGTKWKVKIVSPDKSEKPVADTLVFAKGTFDSIACHKYGFFKASYRARKMKGTVTFTSAVIKNDKGEQMSWRGKIEGKSISGGMLWRPKKGAAKRYTFKGAKA